MASPSGSDESMLVKVQTRRVHDGVPITAVGAALPAGSVNVT